MGQISFCCFVYIVLFLGCVNRLSCETIQLWRNPDGSPGGTLHYKINDRLDSCIKTNILQTIEDFNKLLNPGSSRCIQFKNTDGLREFPYVNFNFAGSCDANIANPGIGSSTRYINVPVNDACIDRRKLVYSLARILGLPDEHTRPDRDKFLTIHWDNLQKSYRHGLYNISSYDFWHTIRHMPYDYTSVTHVGPFEHALDIRKPSVSSKYPGVYFGDHYNLSIIDVRKLRALYDCPPDTGNQRFEVYRPVHCTFDLPLCGLVNDWTSPGAKLTERKGPVSDRGPKTDHSNGDGKYMYLNGSDTLRTASLVSVREISPGPVCVSLYYYMEHNTTTLTISQKDSTSGQTTTIKEIVGSEETSWSEAMFNTKATTAWRILIQASTEQGKVAIDDVTVQYGNCPVYNKCRGQ
ncbi:meprin A subunit alpha-like [Crassostrea angulata]|uniref:meprin A subunit alpha-like n=1 Tax=Magallana angulata TaxID=2784310 RepID=UPI0022B1FAA5|nr:meprin A subunit alpha-like [Crassostrea angulata]